MNEPVLAKLHQYALTAQVHASSDYGVTLQKGDFAQLDAILDHQRTHGERSNAGPMEICYGAWLGESLRERYQGEWVGLYEPCPPRIRIAGRLYSPMEAIRRRLNDGAAPSIVQLTSEVDAHFAKLASRTEVKEMNERQWDALVEDTRFANPNWENMNPESAIHAMDPWLKSEVDSSYGSSWEGLRVLCLAAAGGTHVPLFAKVGARVTVVDISRRMLDLDEAFAMRSNLSIQTLHASMDSMGSLKDATFDLVVQPVSTCYVADIRAVYREVARLLRPGGLYVSQHKQPGSLQADFKSKDGCFTVRHWNGDGQPLPISQETDSHLEPGVIEYIHSFDAILGGLCQAGFQIEDISEPPRADAWSTEGSSEHRALFLPPYLKIKARRALLSRTSVQ